RVNLMGNIMDFFAQIPSGDPSGVEEGVKNVLSHAYPNPFNPVTKIAYSVREAGPVTIAVYNVAGKVVRTLLDTEVDAGASGYVVWDGANDGGMKCASGVYFYRIAAPGFKETRKMIMLK
ncbi:MAG: T9SS type A sorting domain-containing protein, partial [Candidatus Eisenbacteria sp.]|nr:T9SS type A sorting domain-containing protein [Candidatus Eisenbacteria bacterium]